MSKKVSAVLTGLMLGLMAVSSLPVTQAATPTFNDPAFEKVWKRVDLAVQELPRAGRGYTWGPAFAPANKVVSEFYNLRTRKVQYFDKARMEINDPNGDPNDLYYVTTGLLVKELASGLRQDEDNRFNQLAPSNVQVAGDTNEGGQNAIAPTYASFMNVVTLDGTQNTRPSNIGAQVTGRITRDGNISTIVPPEPHTYQAYDSVTGHNIADVFVRFGNDQTGLIWDGTQFITGAIFFSNATYILGRPITEPYWIRTIVAGTEREVLVQLFERRVLTYTPSNSDPYKVEMGNVGQHYYRWRYEDSIAKATLENEFGLDVYGAKNPTEVAVDTQGNSFVINSGYAQVHKYDSTGKIVTYWGTKGGGNGQFITATGLAVSKSGNVYIADRGTNQIQKFDNDGHFLLRWGISGNEIGQFNNLTDLAVDGQGNVYTLENTNKRVQKFDSEGKYLTHWKVDAETPPGKIGVDDKGVVYVYYIVSAGKPITRAQIQKFQSTSGEFLGSWYSQNISTHDFTVTPDGTVYILGGKLEKDDTNGQPTGTPGQSFTDTYGDGIAIGPNGTINITRSSDHRLLKLDSLGQPVYTADLYGRQNGQVLQPNTIVTDKQGNLYVADTYNHRIQKFDSQGKFLLKFGEGKLNYPQFVAVDDQGSVYTASIDQDEVYKYDSQGKPVLTIGSPGKGDGQFSAVDGIAVDKAGNVFVGDGINERVQKFDSQGHFLLKWGSKGSAAGAFFILSNLATDTLNNVYVLEFGSGRVQKFDNQGNFLAQFGTTSGNGKLNEPRALSVDGQGNLYVADTGNNRVAAYDKNGAYLGDFNTSGPVGGQFNHPEGVAVDPQGYIYVADTAQDRIFKFSLAK